MPHLGYAICTSEQRPASTTVSHGFTVARYSSPPFGSLGPGMHSEPSPLDIGSGSSKQRFKTHLEARGFVAFTTHFSFRSALACPLCQLASSKDSLVRVSRRAVGGTGSPSPLSASTLDPHWGASSRVRPWTQESHAVSTQPPDSRAPGWSLSDQCVRRQLGFANNEPQGSHLCCASLLTGPDKGLAFGS